MLADHNRMAAYHAAIMGNADAFKDKVVMDVGTGSGILAVWAAQAGAKRVYAGECGCLFGLDVWFGCLDVCLIYVYIQFYLTDGIINGIYLNMN